MKMSRAFVLATCLMVAVTGAPAAQAGPAGTPADVFAQLKALEGTWNAMAAQTSGEPEAGDGPMTGRFEYQLSGAGSVVVEVMNAGDPHEMINMYHMDGEDLVLTHYCAAGNQPTMKLDREMLAEGKVHFEFTGGTNLDPAVDNHIHSAVLDLRDDGSVVADWTGWSGGQEAAVMQFRLERAE